MSSKKIAVASVAVALAAASWLAGQDRAGFAEAQKQNRTALKQYTWKSRTELKLKGESKNVKLEQVRYDLDGNEQKTDIGGSAPQQEEASGGGRRRGRRGGGLKAKIAENKKQEFAELIKGLGQLVGSYAHLPPEKTQEFANNASFGRGEGDMAGTLAIQGADVQVPGDSMSVWIDPESRMMRRIEIETLFEDNPVSFSGDFRAVTDGPTYPARLVLDYPEKEVQLIIENFDYERVGS